MAFSPDGKTLAVGPDHVASHTRIAFWSVATGRRARASLNLADPTVAAFTFDPDGRTLATVSVAKMQSTARFWDARSGKQHGPAVADISGVTYSPDGRTVAVDGGDSVRVIDSSTRRQIGPDLPGGWGGVAYSRDVQTVATGTSDGIVGVMSLRAGNPVVRIPDAFLDVAFSPDEHTTAGASYDGAVRFWTRVRAPRSGRHPSSRSTRPVECHVQPRRADARDGRIGRPSLECRNALRRRYADRRLQGLQGRGLQPRRADAGNDRDWYAPNPVRLWNLSTGTAFDLPLGSPTEFFYVADAAFSPDARTLAVAWSDESEVDGISIFDVATHTSIRHFATAGPTGHLCSVPTAARSPLPASTQHSGMSQPARHSDQRSSVRCRPSPSAPTERRLRRPATTASSISGTSSTGRVRPAAARRRPGRARRLQSGRQDAGVGRLRGVRLWDVATRAEIGAPLNAPITTR